MQSLVIDVDESRETELTLPLAMEPVGSLPTGTLLGCDCNFEPVGNFLVGEPVGLFPTDLSPAGIETFSLLGESILSHPIHMEPVAGEVAQLS
jgi:hypothetical protein